MSPVLKCRAVGAKGEMSSDLRYDLYSAQENAYD